MQVESSLTRDGTHAPALVGGFLTTGPAGKSCLWPFNDGGRPAVDRKRSGVQCQGVVLLSSPWLQTLACKSYFWPHEFGGTILAFISGLLF